MYLFSLVLFFTAVIRLLFPSPFNAIHHPARLFLTSVLNIVLTDPSLLTTSYSYFLS